MMGYKQRDEFVNDSAVDGKDEEEYNEEWQEIVDEFYEWCDDNDLIGQEV